MPITDFMHKLGCKSTKKRGNEMWFHAPYRSDKTPSFCVNTEKNIFNDFGAGVGGDIFTLAGLMINSTDFMAQVRYIGEVTNNPIERSEPPKYKPEPIVPLFSDALPTVWRFTTGCMISNILPLAFPTSVAGMRFATSSSRAAFRQKLCHL